MFERLREFIFSLIPVRLAMGLFVLHNVLESTYEAFDTDLFKTYFLKRKEEGNNWEPGYYIDMFTVIINIIKIFLWAIVWCITKDMISDEDAIDLRVLTPRYDMRDKTYTTSVENIVV